MKLAYTICIIYCVLSMAITANTNDYEIIIQPQWKKLDSKEETILKFGGEWILAGDITFKNKSKHVIKLDAFDLRWVGSTINNLSATLFKKDEQDHIVPIQDNVICDGYWSEKKQTLKFRFDRKFTLSALNNFYLVFTVPDHLEDPLKRGQFIMTKHHLPYQYQHALKNTPLTLSFTNIERGESQVIV